ncbi:MAG: NAD(+)/NADH kinase [Nanoarchaeota archaeon]|nr:NAD(+)/NADH kinase [Nanoarchaeota archaeon]
MDKVAVCSKHQDKLPEMKSLLESKGFKVVASSPDFVVSFGGDGTLLYSERKFPGVPKLVIRDSKICKKCVSGRSSTVLELVRNDDFILEEWLKVDACFNKEHFLAVNDVIIRNKFPMQAIRLEVVVGEEQLVEEMIGDGLVVATPFGSTAYFNSVTRTSFNKGIGVGFNNSVSRHAPFFLSESDVLKVRIIRGEAHLAFDNSPKVVSLKDGDLVSIKKSKDVMKIINFKNLDLWVLNKRFKSKLEE